MIVEYDTHTFTYKSPGDFKIPVEVVENSPEWERMPIRVFFENHIYVEDPKIPTMYNKFNNVGIIVGGLSKVVIQHLISEGTAVLLHPNDEIWDIDGFYKPTKLMTHEELSTIYWKAIKEGDSTKIQRCKEALRIRFNGIPLPQKEDFKAGDLIVVKQVKRDGTIIKKFAIFKSWIDNKLEVEGDYILMYNDGTYNLVSLANVGNKFRIDSDTTFNAISKEELSELLKHVRVKGYTSTYDEDGVTFGCQTFSTEQAIGIHRFLEIIHPNAGDLQHTVGQLIPSGDLDRIVFNLKMEIWKKQKS